MKDNKRMNFSWLTVETATPLLLSYLTSYLLAIFTIKVRKANATAYYCNICHIT